MQQSFTSKERYDVFFFYSFSSIIAIIVSLIDL